MKSRQKSSQVYLVCLLILLLSTWGYGQSLPTSNQADGLPAEVVKTIEKRLAGEVSPSFALAIVDSTGTRFYNFGTTTMGGVSVDEHTIYEIGSITKVFTGILLANAVLEGKVRLEDDVNSYIPDTLNISYLGSKHITLGSLSDHTSGIPRMPDNFAPANLNNPYADYSPGQMFAFLNNYRPLREVGAQYEYSNLAQGLLGHILAEVHSRSYEELLTETITVPLNMTETLITLNEELKSRLAPGHSNGRVVENWDIPTLAGAGAIRSSTFDMARFISANLGYFQSPIHGALELSHKARHDKAGGMRVGLGWHIKSGLEGDVFWHNGGTGGYRAFAGFVKETGKGVVVLTNSSTSADDIGFHLLDPASGLQEPNMKSDAVSVPEEVLETYVGIYEIQPGFTLTVTREGQQLYTQATGQDRFEIYPRNESEFFLTVVEASLSFQSEKGRVNGLILYQGGREIPGKKIE